MSNDEVERGQGEVWMRGEERRGDGM